MALASMPVTCFACSTQSRGFPENSDGSVQSTLYIPDILGYPQAITAFDQRATPTVITLVC